MLKVCQAKIAKMAQLLEVQLKSPIFAASYPISIFGFLPQLQMVCNTNEIHEDAAMLLFHFFMKNRAEATFNALTCLSSSGRAIEDANQRHIAKS